MKTEVEVERLIVVSDLHLGNPFSEAGRTLAGFIDEVREREFDLVINGDGLEILQADIGTLARASGEVFLALRRLSAAGQQIYYVIGNHDIALEYLLGSWLSGFIVPFLNVRSGEVRIRIEHGHLYDPFFHSFPRLYEWVTRLAGPLLQVRPGLYTLWTRYKQTKAWLAGLLPWQTRTEHYTPFHEGAASLLLRGFDVVIFGHTHRPELRPLDEGTYVNAGNWVRGGTYVEIDGGQVSLHRLERRGRLRQRRT